MGTDDTIFGSYTWQTTGFCSIFMVYLMRKKSGIAILGIISILIVAAASGCTDNAANFKNAPSIKFLNNDRY